MRSHGMMMEVADLPRRAFTEERIGMRSRATKEGGKGGSSAEAPEAQNYYYPDWYAGAQENVVDRGAKQSYQPYQQYTGSRIAGLTKDQTNTMGDILGMKQSPMFDAGAGMIGNAVKDYKGYDAQRFTDDGVAKNYMSPYIQNALNPTLRRIEEAGQKQAMQNNYAAQKAASFGGSRHGVVQSNQQKNMVQQLSDTQAEGMEKAYNTAAKNFQYDEGLAADIAKNKANVGVQGGLGLGTIGTQSTNALARQYEMQMGVGQMQQDQQQRMLDQRYQDFTENRDWERNQIDWYANLLGGMKPELSTEKWSGDTGSTFDDKYQAFGSNLTGNANGGYINSGIAAPLAAKMRRRS